MAKTVLVVDDDPTQRRLIQAVLDREGYAVVHAESGGEAIDRLTKGGGADVVLLDLVMPGLSGLETLAEIRTAGVAVPVIVLTANGGIETVVKAMQAGAQDFFVKPVGPERLLIGVRNALQLTQLSAEIGRLKKHVSGRTSFDDIVGDSPPMRMVKALGVRAAKSGIPVLITGESGVGKEVIARALHGASDRAGKPFIAVNCGALPANLVEGTYKTRIFLIREGRVIDSYSAPLEVRKVGLERWLYRLAFDQPLIYGLMSLLIAAVAGWGASAAFRALQRE